MSKNNVSRRKFLKGGAVLSAAVGLSALTGGKTTEKVAQAFGKKELDSFPHEISPDYKRFKQETTFVRHAKGDPELLEYIKGLPGYYKSYDDSKPGYTQLDYALMMGGFSVERTFTGGSSKGNPNGPMYTWELEPNEHKHQFGSKEDASKAIKKAAKLYGADLIGITPYDDRWVYDPMYSFAEQRDVYDTEFPFKPKSVIVMALSMEYEGFTTSPSHLGDAAALTMYSKMAEVSFKISSFINLLGYKAFGAGNDTAESVPYGIAAGLGEQGRQGILITYEYGPRVRLCKVFTEMELAYDKPIEFGANKFCQVCKKCAENCPSHSISLEDEMTFKAETYSPSNHEGVFKYYVNVDTCYQYWNTITNACGTCISVCPYNKPDFWHHKLTTALTATPLKPFLNEMDDLFGYGNIFDEQACIDYWDLETYAGKKN